MTPKRLSEARLKEIWQLRIESRKLLLPTPFERDFENAVAALLADRADILAEFEQYKQGACKTALSVGTIAGNLTNKLAFANSALAEILMDVERERDEKRMRACVHRTATNARKELAQGD